MVPLSVYSRSPYSKGNSCPVHYSKSKPTVTGVPYATKHVKELCDGETGRPHLCRAGVLYAEERRTGRQADAKRRVMLGVLGRGKEKTQVKGPRG